MTASLTQSAPLGRRMIRRVDMTRVPPGEIRHAVFDFDGTLSLLRVGWQQIMTDYFDEVLAATQADESASTRHQQCVHFITRLTGRQTIYQCLELADQVTSRGGTPLPAEHYKEEYLRRLHAFIEYRRQSLASGGSPDAYLVPGTLELLERLREREITCYLASGTDVAFVRQEAELLGIDDFFTDGESARIYGALADYRKFSKRMVIERILKDHGMAGATLVGFGDGYVEIEETLRVGGWAIAIASDESSVDENEPNHEDGRIDEARMDPWKQERLWQVGAHVLTPDWQEVHALLAHLGLGND